MTRSNGQRSWFGQPPGLTILFLTSMWEQFSYYGMRALLVYYMIKALALSQATSSFVYGAYTACAYFTPMVGGVIADRFLGKRRAVIIGATIMASGHFMMAFEPLFYLALATIAIGNGLFLPSLPSQINDLYDADDPRRARAYNVYYVGINIGGFLAPLICGTLGEFYGWHYGFGAAGIGMLAGLLIYLAGQRHLPSSSPSGTVLPAAGPVQTDYRRVFFLLGAVALAVTVFRGAYEQVGNTVALWADTGIDRRAGGFEIPMTWFQSLNPLLVMLMTPVLLGFWRRRAEAGKEGSAARRMAGGAIVVAAAYLLIAFVAVVDGGDHMKTHWLWLALFFAIFTLGELLVLPTGLGLFARLAPPQFGATTVAAWYFTIFTGSLAAGAVGMLWSAMDPGIFFFLQAGIAAASALFLRTLDRSIVAIDSGAAPLAEGPHTPPDSAKRHSFQRSPQ